MVVILLIPSTLAVVGNSQMYFFWTHKDSSTYMPTEDTPRETLYSFPFNFYHHATDNAYHGWCTPDFNYISLIYLNDTQPISFKYDVSDDGLYVSLIPLKFVEGILTEDVSKNTIRIGNDIVTRNQLLTLTPHDKGFYLLLITQKNVATSTSCDGQERALYNFELVNSYGQPLVSNPHNVLLFDGRKPLSWIRPYTFNISDFNIDADTWDNGSLCTAQGFDWAADFPATLPAERRCCGDDIGQGGDKGFVFTDTKSHAFVCTIDASGSAAWKPLAGQQCPWDPNGAFESILTKGNNYNSLATNGADACCGDDSGTCVSSANSCQSRTDNTSCAAISGCTWTPNVVIETGYLDSSCIIHDAPQCPQSAPYELDHQTDTTTNCCANYGNACDSGASYTSSRTCSPTPTPSGTCASATPTDCTIYADSSSCNGAGCTWENYQGFTHDYGYITPDNASLCYNNQSDLRNPDPSDPANSVWSWLSASGNNIPFKIFTLNNSQYNKTVDTLSNGDAWYYCNASSSITVGLQGKAVAEGQSPTSASNNNPRIQSCLFMAQIFFSKSYNHICSTKPGDTFCCNNNRANIADFDSDCTCLDGSGTKIYSPITQPPGTNGIGGSDGPFDKSACSYDGTGCLFYFDNTKSCAQNNGVLCDAKQNFCVKGQFDAKRTCCYSPLNAAKCEPGTAIDSELNCTKIGGAVYNSTQPQLCHFENASISGTLLSCCFGPLSAGTGVNPWVSKILQQSPNAFLCFKQDTNNLFGQCAYDNSAVNNDIVLGRSVDQSSQRIFSAGKQLHTILSFDTINQTTGLIVDRGYKISIRLSYGKASNKDGALMKTTPLFTISSYSLLEFDIMYPADMKNVSVVLFYNLPSGEEKNMTLGLLRAHLNNGNAAYRWHHAIFNISGIPVGSTYYSLQFIENDFASDYSMLFDSLTAVPLTDADNRVNTPNYYCTGGFGTWIPDLDPNPRKVDLTDWNQYGPYQFACTVQAAFDWTGTQCCGDDTRPGLYGEFYNDTKKGCFNGSKIENDWSVAYIYNIPEFLNAGRTQVNPAFTAFPYKDILYYNNAFYGCQVGDKYNNSLLQTAWNASIIPNDMLITNKITGECAVVGSYYCSNHAWHKITATQGSGTTILRKYAPAGNLIFNGNFEVTP